VNRLIATVNAEAMAKIAEAHRIADVRIITLSGSFAEIS
jgi:hypothetical protein